MQHTITVPFAGDWTKAEELAITTLSGLGFRILSRDNAAIDFTGPGMTSTKQSPMLGATQIHLRGDADTLTLNADLGGVRFMTRFIEIFPGALCFALFAVLMGVFWMVMPNQIEQIFWITAAVIGGNALLWSILGRFLAKVIKARSCRALDAFANNLAMPAAQSKA